MTGKIWTKKSAHLANNTTGLFEEPYAETGLFKWFLFSFCLPFYNVIIQKQCSKFQLFGL